MCMIPEKPRPRHVIFQPRGVSTVNNCDFSVDYRDSYSSELDTAGFISTSACPGSHNPTSCLCTGGMRNEVWFEFYEGKPFFGLFHQSRCLIFEQPDHSYLCIP